MIENLVVILILGAAVLYLGRALYRSMTGKNQGCSCCAEQGCPQAETCGPSGRQKD